MILFPTKSRVVILPAVPTTTPSSLTINPFRILLTENIPGTSAQVQPPTPSAFARYSDPPKSVPSGLSFGA